MSTLSTPPWLARCERRLAQALRLEHGANVLPLAHVALYYVDLVLLAWPGLLVGPWLRAPAWVALCLLSYSLSIGILHMHAHRRLFVSAPANRVLELLLAFPCGLSYPVMRLIHVFKHHRYEDGEGDPTSTRHARRGLAAVGYWLSYGARCQLDTFLSLFARTAPAPWRALRRQYVLDAVVPGAVVVAWTWIEPVSALWLYWLPLAVVQVNIGYFAWLTHAPAGEGPVNGSLNTPNRWMNLFIHNQGYHAVHHRWPGVHWTELPDRLALMEEVEDRLIVPYWVTLPSAWRVLRPARFHDPTYGARWKQRYRQRLSEGRHRLSLLPYFVWI